MKGAITIGTILAFFLLLIWPPPREAEAVKEFMDQFEDRYVDHETRDPVQRAFNRRFATTRCNVCHVQGEKKDVRNAYGRLLDDYLSREDHKNDRDRIQQVLRYVESVQVDPDDERSETFGARIERGHLP